MKQKAAHTPGPWLIEWNAAQGGEGHYITDSKDMVELSRIAAVLFHDDAVGETRANARLIAAAPDLFEIARAIVAVCDSGKYAEMACMEGSPLVDAARAAIAKAEGGAA